MTTDEKTGIEGLLAAKVLQIVSMSAVLIYIVILVIWYSNFSPILTDDSTINIITAAFGVVGVVSIALAHFISRWMIKRYKQKPELQEGFLFAQLTRCAFFVSIAIYGLVLGLLGADWEIALPFLIVAAGAMILTFPTRGRWKKMLE